MLSISKIKVHISELICFLVLLVLFLSFFGCGNTSSADNLSPVAQGLTVGSGLETKTLTMRYRTFQNSDSTWGFVLLLNSRPYLLYRKVPGQREKSGFESYKEAELVASLFLKMIENGNPDPKLNRKMIDSLNLLINQQ